MCRIIYRKKKLSGERNRSQSEKRLFGIPVTKEANFRHQLRSRKVPQPFSPAIITRTVHLPKDITLEGLNSYSLINDSSRSLVRSADQKYGSFISAAIH